MGKDGTGTLKVDGTVLDSHPMSHSLPISIMWNEGFDVGLDTGTPVDDSDYQPPEPKVLLRNEVLEIRNVDGRLHLARKVRYHD